MFVEEEEDRIEGRKKKITVEEIKGKDEETESSKGREKRKAFLYALL